MVAERLPALSLRDLGPLNAVASPHPCRPGSRRVSWPTYESYTSIARKSDRRALKCFANSVLGHEFWALLTPYFGGASPNPNRSDVITIMRAADQQCISVSRERHR